MALAAGASAQLPGMGRGDLPAIDAKVQAAVIDSITAALKEGYVFADKAARMDSLLRVNLAPGAIDGVVGMYDDGREERNPKGK